MPKRWNDSSRTRPEISSKSKDELNPKTLEVIWLSSVGTQKQLARTTNILQMEEGIAERSIRQLIPENGRNVVLQLDRETGLVSPQVYVAIDPLFENATTRKVELAEQSRIIGQREAKSPDRLKVDSTINSIMPPTCMDVVSANLNQQRPQREARRSQVKKNEKMRHHTVRRFLRSHHRLQQHEVSQLQHLGIAIHQHLRATMQSSTK